MIRYNGTFMHVKLTLQRTIWISIYERVVKIVQFWMQNSIFFSRLRYQLYVISALAFRTNFEKYRVAFCWPILSQYIGMHLFSLHAVAAHKIWILPKTMNVNITSIIDNWGSKIHLHHVMQLEWHGVRQNLRMLTNIHHNLFITLYLGSKLIWRL